MCRSLSMSCGEDLPASAYALQIVIPSIIKLDSRTDHEVSHGPGDEDLPTVHSYCGMGLRHTLHGDHLIRTRDHVPDRCRSSDCP